jgi:methyl-accepting chemotaxis protein
MKISTKLLAFAGGVIVVFGVLALTLLFELRSMAMSYDAVVSGPLRQMDAARVVQLDFKKQVQEWKDILVRGHTPADLEKYTRQFHAEDEAVRASAARLAAEIEDPAVQSLIGRFIDAHDSLDRSYQAAYDAFLASGFDSSAADAQVRGRDRAPTDLFDEVVATLGARAAAAVAAERQAVERGRNVAIGVCLLMLITTLGLGAVTVRSVLARLARLKSVSDRLARAEVEGLAVDISGTDEIGEFGESLKGVHAAIEELMGMAAAHDRASV